MANKEKFQCHYKLTLSWFDNENPMQAVITDPISIQFNISKVMQGSSNNSRIVVYNMDAGTREYMYQDVMLLNESINKMVTLEAGYGDNLTLVLYGRVVECHSVRQGTDMITTIDVIDPDILTEHTGVTFEPNTTFQEAYSYMASQFPNLSQGDCGNIDGVFKVPTVFDGNSFVVINKLTGGHTFVDNGKLVTLNDNETLSDYGCYYIASETGFLETPKRYDGVLEITMLFEPTIRMGQMVEIKSETRSRFDGQYKVIGINHNCTISGADCGTRITTLQLQYIQVLENSNVNITNNPAGSPPSKVENEKIIPLSQRGNSTIDYVLNFVRKTKGQIPNLRINRIATWSNMIGNNNRDNERVSDLTKTKLANCEAIADRVRDFCDNYFGSKQVTITSGWRSVANNRREGGVDNSQHLKGRAIDFKIAGVSPKTIELKAKQSKMFSYVKSYSSWIHVDVRS